MKRIIFSEEAKTDIRAIPKHIAMIILQAIHRLAEHGSGNVRDRFTEEHPETLRVHTVKNCKDAYR